MQNEREGSHGEGDHGTEPLAGPEEEVAVPADQRHSPAAETPRCDLCGGVMVEHHCKLICLNCGYTRDCSDP
jgi:hypothetical protein